MQGQRQGRGSSGEAARKGRGSGGEASRAGQGGTPIRDDAWLPRRHRGGSALTGSAYHSQCALACPRVLSSSYKTRHRSAGSASASSVDDVIIGQPGACVLLPPQAQHDKKQGLPPAPPLPPLPRTFIFSATTWLCASSRSVSWVRSRVLRLCISSYAAPVAWGGTRRVQVRG